MWVKKQKEVVELGDKAFFRNGTAFCPGGGVFPGCPCYGRVGRRKLEPGQPVCTPHKIPAGAQGIGLTEAARGALGHWHKIEHGRTAVYNAVVPTTWNMSPRDDQGVMGPGEQALIGTPVKDPKNPVEVVRVVRSFDHCLDSAIHVMTPDKKVVSQFTVS